MTHMPPPPHPKPMRVDPAAHRQALSPAPEIAPSLKVCEPDQIRLPDMVQAHGALLVLEPSSGRIEAASESCLNVLGVQASHLVGQLAPHCLEPRVTKALLGDLFVPRTSVGQFAQLIRDRSMEWSAEELASAATLGSLIDIDALHEREAFAQSVLNSIPDHLCVVDKDGVIVTVNEAWERFGLANGAPDGTVMSVGANYRDACSNANDDASGSEASAAWAGIEGVIQKRLATFSLDYPCDSLDGRRWFQMNVWPMIAPCEGVLVVHSNITDRKLAELNAAELVHGQQAILNSDVVGLFKMTAQQIIWSNAALANRLGYQAEELVGQPIQQFFASQTDFTAFVKRSQQPSRVGETNNIEVNLRRKNGTVGWFEINLSTVDQQAQKYLGTLLDISARKAATIEVEQRRQSLEDLVAARTEDLSRARDAAEKANRAKSIFLATMSHELRTPLNAILGMTRLASKRASDSKQIEQLGKVQSASRHLLGVIDDILDFSRIEASMLELQQRDFKLNDVIEGLESLVRLQAADKSLVLNFQLAARLDGMALRGDAQRLGQVLLNLVSNAIKFTKAGSIDVRAMLVDDRHGAVLLRFEVQDTGIGIAGADQQRVFQVFEQADDSTARRHGGSGLGLAISKRLVHMMGGDIGLHSKPGIGSTFWFTVRFEKSATTAFQSERPAMQSALSQVQARHIGCRVLVAEDDPVNREIIQAVLEESGLTVDLAEDGLQAVDLAARGDYDLILMDIQMPRMGGLEAAQRIRRSHNAASMPIIALTAGVFSNEAAQCRDADMNDFIGKPFDPEVLYSVLLKWLDHANP